MKDRKECVNLSLSLSFSLPLFVSLTTLGFRQVTCSEFYFSLKNMGKLTYSILFILSGHSNAQIVQCMWTYSINCKYVNINVYNYQLWRWKCALGRRGYNIPRFSFNETWNPMFHRDTWCKSDASFKGKMFTSRNKKHRMHVESSEISNSFLLKIRSLKFKYYTVKKKTKICRTLRCFPWNSLTAVWTSGLLQWLSS